MFGCIYEMSECPYEIDTLSCSVGEICNAINETGCAPVKHLLKKINLLTRAIDSLAEQQFLNADGLEWLQAFEKSETPAKKDRIEIPYI